MHSSREDYILAIYRLTKDEEFVHSVAIAKTLQVSRASVSEMIKKLSQENYISFIDHKIKLTKKGIEKAQSIISSHRLWEYFLIEHLQMPWEEAHQEADLLEHVTSDSLKAALNKYLNYPDSCPSGHKIWSNKPRKKKNTDS